MASQASKPTNQYWSKTMLLNSFEDEDLQFTKLKNNNKTTNLSIKYFFIKYLSIAHRAKSLEDFLV